MTNQIRNPNDQKTLVRFLLLAGTSLTASAACWWAARGSLGLFFGGLFIVTFLMPAGVLEQPKLLRALGGAGAVVAPVAVFWLGAVITNSATPDQWGQATIVLLAYALAIGGIALGLARIGLPPIFGAAIAIVIGLAWLTWPVWLSGISQGGGMDRLIQHLVPLHPPLTVNGILTSEPAWTERSVAYHLTNLNQDVAIQLPTSGKACALLHGAVGLVLWAAAFVGRRKG